MRPEGLWDHSETHKELLHAVILQVGAEGRIKLNVEPIVWLSLEVQGSKVRPVEGALEAKAAVHQAAPAGCSVRF